MAVCHRAGAVARPISAPGPIAARDTIVARVAWLLLNPGPVVTGALVPIRLREDDDIAGNIEVLGGVEPPDLEEGEARVHQAFAAAAARLAEGPGWGAALSPSDGNWRHVVSGKLSIAGEAAHRH